MKLRLVIIAGAVVLAALGLASVGNATGVCVHDYTVRAGDSLGRIAKRCGVSVSEIRSLNGLGKGGHLQIGQQLQLREGGPVIASDQPMELTGQIVNGRWCAQLHTPEGQIYGVVSPKVAFRSGAVVRVKAVPVSGERCTPGQTLVVTDLTPLAQ